MYGTPLLSLHHHHILTPRAGPAWLWVLLGQGSGTHSRLGLETGQPCRATDLRGGPGDQGQRDSRRTKGTGQGWVGEKASWTQTWRTGGQGAAQQVARLNWGVDVASLRVKGRELLFQQQQVMGSLQRGSWDWRPPHGIQRQQVTAHRWPEPRSLDGSQPWHVSAVWPCHVPHPLCASVPSTVRADHHGAAVTTAGPRSSSGTVTLRGAVTGMATACARQVGPWGTGPV